MSRSFTLSAECLGTKLEWDCHEEMAETVVAKLSEELAATCLRSQEEGNGYCGTVSHRMVGLAAYYHINRLATYMFKRKSTAHAIMLRNMCEQYQHVLHSSQELTFLLGEESLLTNAETASCIVEEVLKQAELFNVPMGVLKAITKMKREGLLSEDTSLNELHASFDDQDWALSLTVAAAY